MRMASVRLIASLSLTVYDPRPQAHQGVTPQLTEPRADFRHRAGGSPGVTQAVG